MAQKPLVYFAVGFERRCHPNDQVALINGVEKGVKVSCDFCDAWKIGEYCVAAANKRAAFSASLAGTLSKNRAGQNRHVSKTIGILCTVARLQRLLRPRYAANWVARLPRLTVSRFV